MPKERTNPMGRNKGKGSFYLKKIFICLMLFIVIQGFNKIDIPLTQKITDGVRYMLTYNYDFNKAIEESKIISFMRNRINPGTLKTVFNQSKAPVQKEDLTLDEDLALPVFGEITSGFGLRMHPILDKKRMHNGIDISAEIGSDIRVISAGTVEKASEDPSLGKYIIIDHKNNMKTMYAHCSKILVEEGDIVKKQQIIGQVGNTGLTDGSHLHFEVWLMEAC